MSKQDIPVTQAVRVLREKKIAFTPHFYAYEERGGTKLSSESLGVSEHNVINLARFLRVKTISPCDLNTANKHTGYIMTSAKRWM
jgi:prolyl-tRNA editing enzyme YbaK/EbsC (Cys-tRNA(Pro) deacylase)